MLVLAAAILGFCLVFAAQISKINIRLMAPEDKKPEIKRGNRYMTMVGQDALITSVTGTHASGFIISTGFTAPIRTPCQWDTSGRALAHPRAYDLKEI